MGAEGEKKRACPPPSAQQAPPSLSFFPVQHFSHHQPSISNPQCAREHERVCLMCVCVCVGGEVRGWGH